jgi:cytoskeletal protein RodZ
MEENQSEAKKEYEAKKQERLEKRKDIGSSSQSKESGKKLLRWLFWLIVLALIGWWVITGVRKNIPQGEDFSQSFENAGGEHIEVGSVNTLPEGTYNSNPPSSGPHYPSTAQTGFYSEPLEDQFMIHNLEHGDIWIAYHPRISDQAKSELEDLADRYVIITPREANDFDISVMSWGRVDSFNLEGSVPVQRVKDFILRYDNKGPESVRAGGR